MAGKSSKSQKVSFWLPNETIDKINRALEHPANTNFSVGNYCKVAIIRYTKRHEYGDKTKKRYTRKDLINVCKRALEITQDPAVKRILEDAIDKVEG